MNNADATLKTARDMCPIHGDKEWVYCWNCEDGYSGHDCGDDCCCCLDPEDNVRCDICNGKSGWLICRSCYPSEEAETA